MYYSLKHNLKNDDYNNLIQIFDEKLITSGDYNNKKNFH